MIIDSERIDIGIVVIISVEEKGSVEVISEYLRLVSFIIESEISSEKNIDSVGIG